MNEPSSASLVLRISLNWLWLLLRPFQQLLQLSSCVSAHLSSFYCVLCFKQFSYWLSFWNWSEELQLPMAAFLSPTLMHYFAYSDSRFDQLGTGSICCRSMKMSNQTLKVWPLYLLSPGDPLWHFGDGVLAPLQVPLECPNKSTCSPGIPIAEKWRLCVLIHYATRAPLSALGRTLTQNFLA